MPGMSLIIDGHNLIGAGLLPGIRLGDEDDEWQLVLVLRAYAAARRVKLTVVFDSGPGAASARNPSSGNVQVRFAPPGVEADEVILQLLRDSRSPATTPVVTNDRALAGLVKAAGGQVRSATVFARELAPSRERTPARPPTGIDPKDPAFADIYAGFAAADKDAARFGDEITLDAGVWIERLYGDDGQEAARAAHWLGRFGGPAALEPLIDALTHRSATVRAAAALALGQLGNRRALGPLAERLAGDPSAMVREAAAQGLALLGGPAAESALTSALSDGKVKVRKAAEAGLTQLRARQG